MKQISNISTKTKCKSATRACIVFMILLFSAGSLFAAKPASVKSLEIFADQMQIVWIKGSSGAFPSGYYLYAAEGQTNDLSKFKKVSLYKYESYNDSIEKNVAGNHYITSDGGETWYKNDVFTFGGVRQSFNSDTLNGLIQKFAPFSNGGEFSLFMTAFNDDGESQPSEIKNLKIKKAEDYPSAPTDFSVVANWTADNDNQANFDVNVKWKYSAGSKPSGYRLYAVLSKYYPGYGSLENAELINDWELELEKGQSADQQISFKKSIAGFNYITFFMKSYEGTVVSKRSDLKVVKLIKDPKFVRITSNPSFLAYAGVQYSYKVIANTNQGETLSYELLNGPEGMTLDKTTGELRWTPSSKGTYSVSLRAVLNSDTNYTDTQDYFLLVKQCSKATILIADVKDDKGNAIDCAMAYAYDRPPADSSDVQYAARIANGKMFMRIDEGVFRLYIDGLEKYPNQWWNGKETFETADEIRANCGDTIRINIILGQFTKTNFYTVKGKVTDRATGNPVQYATVEFLVKDSDGEPRNVFRTFTHDDGKYEIDLQEGIGYIAAAYVLNEDSSVVSKKYLHQFYNKTSDLTLAQTITLTSNLDGIDFALDERTEYKNSISGKIVDKNYQLIKNVNVIAFPVGLESQFAKHLYRGLTVRTDIDGSFKLDNLIPGQYVIFVFSRSVQMAPGYYKINEPAVHSWKDATIININDHSDITDLTIQISEMKRISGHGKLQGLVSDAGGIIKSGDQPLASMHLQGAIVYLINKSNGTVSDFTLSQNDGKYILNNVGIGQYTMLIDRVGYDKFVQSVTITSDTETQEISPGLNTNGTLAVDDQFADNINLNISPNPARDYVRINLTNATEKIRLSISTLAGLELYSGIVDASSIISVRDLPAGVYLIYVYNGRQFNAAKLNVVR